MSLLIPSSFISLSRPHNSGLLTSKSYLLTSRETPPPVAVSTDHGIPCLALKRRHSTVPKLAAVVGSFQPESDGGIFFDFGDLELDGTEDLDSPWEGAVVYRRNSSVPHVEYCTTLERLGLEKLSSATSKSRASEMGIRVTKSVKDYPLGTPVLISVDVTRKKKKLRLDGIIRTVITLGCNRCGDPAAEPVYSNFSLLLTEDPIDEPETLNMGTIFGEDKSKPSPNFEHDEEGEDADEADIDMDDWLYFPVEEKEIDISKNIRDMVHLEITLNAVCSPGCKGLCLRCGTNLNSASCSCTYSDEGKREFGPLGNLRKQMQQH